MILDRPFAYGPLPDPDLNAEFYTDVPAKRLLAWVVDTVITAAITALIVPFTAFTALFFLPLLYLAVAFAYRAVTIARHGATPGMRLMAISLHGARGGTLTPAEAMVHTGLFLTASAMVLPQVISIVMMLMTARGQSLVDLMLGTVMLNRAGRM